MATVFITSLMQNLTAGQSKVEVEGSTIRQIVENLEKAHPGMKERLVDRHKIKPNISVAIDGEVTPIGMLEKVGENSESNRPSGVIAASNSDPGKSVILLNRASASGFSLPGPSDPTVPRHWDSSNGARIARRVTTPSTPNAIR